MNFEILVIIVALVILVVSLIVVFFNLKPPDKSFPRSFTNCPDYWKVNPETGNCIIPSKDISNANLGNLANDGKGTPIYIYNYGKRAETSTLTNNDDNKGIPYKENGYTVYAYNDKPPKYDIPPFAYYSMARNTVEEQDKLMLNVIKRNEINFNSPLWSQYDGGGSSICKIKDWIEENNISWDGLNSYNECN